MDNVGTIKCSQNCGKTGQYLNCAKCVYEIILSLSGVIKIINYKHMSRLTQVLDYDLPTKLALINCPENYPIKSLALQKWNHIRDFH